MTLLPCPFCGGTDITLAVVNYWYAMCAKCYAQSGLGDTEEAAAARWNRRASYAAHLPAVMAATEPVQLARPLPMAEVVEERSCFTCANDWSAGRPPFHYCNCTTGDVQDYMAESGAETSPDGLPTDRALKCPGWAPKEPT
jgi:Lar family restriction alleviation protein